MNLKEGLIQKIKNGNYHIDNVILTLLVYYRNHQLTEEELIEILMTCYEKEELLSALKRVLPYAKEVFIDQIIKELKEELGK